jgi:WD40 repeat protein
MKSATSASLLYPNAGINGALAIVLVLLLSCHRAVSDEPEPAPPWIRAIAFSPDGKTLAVCTGEPTSAGSVSLFDVASRKPIWTHKEKVGIPAVVFSPDGKTLAIGGYDHTAKLLDIDGGKVTATIDHPKEVRGVAFSPDGKLLATACWDMAFRVWDLATKTEKLAFKGFKDRPFRITFSSDGKLLLGTAGNDGAKLWDLETGRELRTFTHGQFYVSCATFSPDGLCILTGGYDGTARVWRAETGELQLRLNGAGGVHDLAFSPLLRSLALAGYGRNLSLFELAFEKPSAKEQEQIKALITKLDDDSYDVREAASQDLLKVGFLAESELRRASQESKSVEVRIRARRLRQEMLSKPKTSLRGHKDQIDAVAFSPDGKTLVSGSKDGTVRFWDVATGKETGKIQMGP